MKKKARKPPKGEIEKGRKRGVPEREREIGRDSKIHETKESRTAIQNSLLLLQDGQIVWGTLVLSCEPEVQMAASQFVQMQHDHQYKFCLFRFERKR